MSRGDARRGTVGLVVTTYNSEDWFADLYRGIPFDVLDECVIVNGGASYVGDYDRYTAWIQHDDNHGPCQARIDGIKHLLARGVEHIFVIEDDMLILDATIFTRYIDAAARSGLKYLSYCGLSRGSGAPGARTPRLVADYGGTRIAFYQNMHNEFAYHHRSVFEQAGFYDSDFEHLWDVEFVYRVMRHQPWLSAAFWWFPDIVEADRLIKSHPASIDNSRLNARQARDQELPRYYQMFQAKHGLARIPDIAQAEFISRLRALYPPPTKNAHQQPVWSSQNG